MSLLRALARSCFTLGSEATQRGRRWSLQVCLTKSSINRAVVLGSTVTGLSSGAGGAFTLDHSLMMVWAGAGRENPNTETKAARGSSRCKQTMFHSRGFGLMDSSYRRMRDQRMSASSTSDGIDGAEFSWTSFKIKTSPCEACSFTVVRFFVRGGNSPGIFFVHRCLCVPRPRRHKNREMTKLQIFNEAGVDQHAIEMPRLGTVVAAVKQPIASQQDFLLLGERRIERQAGGVLYHDRKIGTFQRVERRRHVGRFEIDRIDRVIGREIALVPVHQMLLDRGVVERRIEDVRREVRLMVAKAHKEKGVVRELPLQPLEEVDIVLRAERLPAQIFVDRRYISQVLPLRHQVGPIAEVPGEMIGGEIDENEHRAVLVLLLDHLRRGIEEKTVRLDIFGAEIVLIVEMLHAGRGLVATRAHERAERRIEREGAIAAAAQRRRQSALDASGGDPGHEIREAAERARRQAFQYVVFGEPARAAIAFDQEVALLAVERLEVGAIAVRDLDPRRHADVEARLVVDQDDVRRLLGRPARL